MDSGTLLTKIDTVRKHVDVDQPIIVYPSWFRIGWPAKESNYLRDYSQRILNNLPTKLIVDGPVSAGPSFYWRYKQMKKPQDRKKKKIQEQQDEFIKTLKLLRDEKDIDSIVELFMKVITMYGLKMDEVAAVTYYMNKQTIQAPHNALFLKERLKLDVTNLSVEGLLKVQEALVNVYVGDLIDERRKNK